MGKIEEIINGNPELASIDLEALREKYKQERDRRIRADGENQYIEVSGKYAHYGLDDPYTPKIQSREPITSEVEIVVVGSGWGGLLTGARLKQAGIDDFLILESAGDVGGTWYWNRYPGCQCDLDAYVYLPLLEETDYMPSAKYAFAPEIFRHAQRIADRFGLYANARFHTNVKVMRWQEQLGRWIVTTDRGDEIKARYVVTATGSTNRPKLPGIVGLDDFEGKIFHTARWDYEYSGGDNTGNLYKLIDKKIAFIGTGGTGIQVVPHLGQWAEHLYVFQRTPSSVDLRLNQPTDPEWVRSLKPGWQAVRQRNYDDIYQGKPVPNMIDDALTGLSVALRKLIPTQGAEDLTPEDMALLSEYADALAMTGKRARVDAEVKDPKVAEILKPWYRLLCKRPTFNDDYLATFNRKNVTLVDTSSCHGVERLTKTGIVANGLEYQVDCIILATGFEVSSSYRKRMGFEIYGRDGENLFDHWSNGMSTFQGWGVHGFPNWFYLGSGQNGFSINYTSNCDTQAKHIAHIIGEARKAGAVRIEPTAQGEADWVAEIRRLAAAFASLEFLEACTPGYFNNEGQSSGSARSHVLGADFYGAGPSAFQDRIAAWRADGKLDGLKLS